MFSNVYSRFEIQGRLLNESQAFSYICIISFLSISLKLAFFLKILARSILNIMPGSANLVFLMKNKTKQRQNKTATV